MRTISGTIARAYLSLACLVQVTTTSAWSCPCADVSVPANAQADIDSVKGLAYTYTPAYREEFAKAIKSARKALEAHKGEPAVAVVSDLDETLLDNREEIKQHPDGSWAQFLEWMRQSKAPVLKPTADLLAWARRNGYAVFFVTGRMEKLRKATIENLVRNNIAYDGLYMRTDGDKGKAEAVKVPLREAIEALGFKIVLNIGDQYSDLTGGHADNCEKLPNRMYFVE